MSLIEKQQPLQALPAEIRIKILLLVVREERSDYLLAKLDSFRRRTSACKALYTVSSTAFLDAFSPSLSLHLAEIRHHTFRAEPVIRELGTRVRNLHLNTELSELGEVGWYWPSILGDVSMSFPALATLSLAFTLPVEVGALRATSMMHAVRALRGLAGIERKTISLRDLAWGPELGGGQECDGREWTVVQVMRKLPGPIAGIRVRV